MSDFYAPWIEDPDDPSDTEDDFLVDYNPNHYPAGTEGSKGGEFAPKASQTMEPGGDGDPNPYKAYMTDEMYRRMKNSIAVAKAMPETYLINNTQRDLMRQQIADKLYNRDIDKRVQGREATIILGLPGAGKSTLANPLIKNGAIEIDPDIVKQEIPEFNGGIGANAVHEESSMINKQILQRAVANGDNIVWPRIDGTDKLKTDIAKLQQAGYKVHVAIIDVSQETAIKSAVDRFEHTGRLVSPSTILEYGDTPAQSYNIAKSIPGVTVARYKREHGQGVEAVLDDYNPNHDPDNGRFTAGTFAGETVVRRNGRKKVRQHEVFAENEEEAKNAMISNRKAIGGLKPGENVTVENVKKIRGDYRKHAPKYPNKGSKEWHALQEMQKRYDELEHKGD